MSNIIVNTKKSYLGPWLLSIEALEELDSIFDEFETQIQAKIKDQVSSEIKIYKDDLVSNLKMSEADLINIEELYDRMQEVSADIDSLKYGIGSNELYTERGQYAAQSILERKTQITDDYKVQRNLTLELDADRSLCVKNFKEASECAEINKDLICGFEYSLSSNSRRLKDASKISVVLKKSYPTEVLEIQTSPSGTSMSTEMYGKVLKWVNKYRLNCITRLVNKLDFMWSTMLLVLLCLYFRIINSAGEGVGIRNLRDQALTMLDQGVDKMDLNSAIALLIRHEFEITDVPATATQSSDPILTYALIIVVIVAAAAAHTPKTSLEIGERGGAHYKFWRWWHKIALIVTPGTLIAGIMTSIIATKLI